MALRNHIARTVTPEGFTTYCGKHGIPNDPDPMRRFKEGDELLQGRVPMSAGNGIQAVTGSLIHPGHPGGLCLKCMDNWAKGD